MNKGILLLSCCAPCSCAVVEKLARDKVLAEVVFYN
ncbi:MAG: epoxyqueuosine reductase QueH, partial [Alphaproteobacteria bacterium]